MCKTLFGLNLNLIKPSLCLSSSPVKFHKLLTQTGHTEHLYTQTCSSPVLLEDLQLLRQQEETLQRRLDFNWVLRRGS